jgi:hypothetical protein
MNLHYPETYAEVIRSNIFPKIVGMGIQGLVALHDKYAVKIIHANNLHSRHQAFLEIKVLQTINNTKYRSLIPKYISYVKRKDYYVIITEFLAGYKDLSLIYDSLDDQDKHTLSQTVKYVGKNITDILCMNNIINQDWQFMVKKENDEWYVKAIDFGMCIEPRFTRAQDPMCLTNNRKNLIAVIARLNRMYKPVVQ